MYNNRNRRVRVSDKGFFYLIFAISCFEAIPIV